jgi:segregation and condensation protein A
VQYNYTMEGVREHMMHISKEQKTLAFEKIFENCESRIHAIFIFLNMLELVQQKFLHILIGEGRNNFIIEYNEDRTEDQSTELTAEDFSHLN